MTKALFIFDFDLTISQEHIHNRLASAIAAGLITRNSVDAQWHYVKSIPPTGTKEQWRNLFEKLIQAGNNVAIASFCDFQPIVERYLRTNIGLSESIMEKIYIESWLPPNPNTADKSKHIENIIKHLHYTGEPNTIVLIDDSKINLIGAQVKKYKVIEVVPGDKTGKHIESALMLLQQFENQ